MDYAITVEIAHFEKVRNSKPSLLLHLIAIIFLAIFVYFIELFFEGSCLPSIIEIGAAILCCLCLLSYLQDVTFFWLYYRAIKNQAEKKISFLESQKANMRNIEDSLDLEIKISRIRQDLKSLKRKVF